MASILLGIAVFLLFLMCMFRYNAAVVMMTDREAWITILPEILVTVLITVSMLIIDLKGGG